MKAHIQVFVFTLISIAVAEAQENRIGVKGGINFANFTGYQQIGQQAKIGINAGLLYELRLNDKISFQPEVLYSSQGTEYRINENQFKIFRKTNFSYINVPVVFRYYPIEFISLEVGPQIGYLIEANEKIDVDGESVSKAIITDDYKTLDFSAVFGLTAHLKMGLFISGRYNLGLSLVDDKSFIVREENKIISVMDRKNSVFQISVGYSL